MVTRAKLLADLEVVRCNAFVFGVSKFWFTLFSTLQAIPFPINPLDDLVDSLGGAQSVGRW